MAKQLDKTQLERTKLRADKTQLLERAKLRVQIRKLEAEAESAELAAAYNREQAEHRASDPARHRTYSFASKVTGDSVEAAIKEIGRWARQDPRCYIKVVFNSPGGSVLDGLALYDFLLALQEDGHELETVALGMAASMGGILLQAGGVRRMSPNSHLLIHEISTLAGGKFSELEDEVEFVKKLQGRLLAILAERSTLTAAQIKRRWLRRDWWLSAEESLELGFIDEIGH